MAARASVPLSLRVVRHPADTCSGRASHLDRAFDEHWRALQLFREIVLTGLIERGNASAEHGRRPPRADSSMNLEQDLKLTLFLRGRTGAPN